MKKDAGANDVQHWTQPAYVAPGIGAAPPAGAVIGKDAVCRDCMTAAEEIAMRRGFADPISSEEAEGKEYLCTRCGKRIPPGS